MNVKYSELLDEVLPSLAADPSDPVTENAIKRSVIEMCRRAWIWKFLADAIDVMAGVSTYDLEPPIGAVISTVVSAELEGVALTPRSPDWLNREVPRWRVDADRPRHFTQFDTEQIVLASVPDANIPGGLTMTLALQPSQSSTSFPKWLFNQYTYDFAEGAIAKLMLIPGKPWTDLAGGADRRARFEASIANARASAVSGLSGAVLRVTGQH